MESRMKPKRKPWEIPSDILESILKRLSLIDMLRAKAVCRSWKSTVEALLSLKTHSCLLKTPWLLLPPKEEYSENIGTQRPLRVMNPEDNNMVYSLKVTPAYDLRLHHYIGSSRGWLIIADQSANPFLLNPLTQQVIQLPTVESLSVAPNVDGPFWDTLEGLNSKREGRQANLSKAVLTSEPNCNYSVILMYKNWVRQRKELAYSKNGSGPWTDLIKHDLADDSYEDIVCRGNGSNIQLLFAVSGIGCVQIWDFQGPYPERMKLIRASIPYPDEHNIFRGRRHFWVIKFYLVVLSAEEIVLFGRLFVFSTSVPNPTSCKTRLFHIYKLQQQDGEDKWVEVNSLGDPYSLFVGRNESAIISSQDSLTCKANSVYFTDDQWSRDSGKLCGGRDMGIYSMEDGSIQQLYEFGSDDVDPPPCWLVH